MLPLTILLFVLPKDLDYVSEALSDATIFLDDPSSYNPAYHDNARYHNPHCPPPGGHARIGISGKPITSASGQRAPGTVIATQPHGKTVEVQRVQVEGMFKNMRDGASLNPTDPG